MTLWILSELHKDRGVLDKPPPPGFDVFVCAGDGDTTGRAPGSARWFKMQLQGAVASECVPRRDPPSCSATNPQVMP